MTAELRDDPALVAPIATAAQRRSAARERVAEAFDRAAALAAEDAAVFITVADRDAALAALAAAGPDAPLAGFTFAVKDNIDVAGLPTTAACPSYSYLPTADATVVARLLAAGATCIGKTNLDQFATGLVGTRSPYGTPRNPVDARLAPGGSSSGSAVAVARGVVDAAFGTDTAGSGRVPAAQCRIVGIKPTPGRLSNRGVVPAVRSVDCVSVFSAEVGTGVLVRAAVEGDDGDPFTRPLQAWPRRIRRLGIPSGTGLVLDGALDADAWDRTVAMAAALEGVELVEVDVEPLLRTGRLLYESAWVAERYAAVGGHVIAAAGHDDVDPVVRAIIEPAVGRSAVEAYEGSYRLAELRRAAGAAWAGVDGLLVPTTPGVATLDEVAADPIGRNSRLGVYTNGINLLGWCAVAVPGADRGDGWPFGVTIAGPAWADDAVAILSAQLAGQAPPPAVLPDGLDVAVVGAHLSGMPLNHQLVDRGAVRVCETATAPHYRLWAMAGGPVPKPALQHVGPGGASLVVEVWRLPWASVGPFLAEIPPPLGLGTLSLADGTEVTGFIAEPRALDGAADVTTFGGWRAYIAAR